MKLAHPYTVHRATLQAGAHLVLVPDDHEAREHLASIPPGEAVLVTIERARHPQFADLVYATFRLVGNAMNWRARNVRGWLAIRTGRADVVHWPTEQSRKTIVPHGTGPSEMNNVELEGFWQDAREVIREEVLPFVHPTIAEQIQFRIE